MLLTDPYLAKYSTEYRKRLFLQFNLTGNMRFAEALRINVQKFGKDESVNES